MPVTNSATIAPIRERPALILNPDIIKGKADGSFKNNNVCMSLALYNLNKSTRPWLVLFNPIIVLDKIGKKDTNHAQINEDMKLSSTKIMISGAIAIIGVTCKIIA